jgi:hypothetical protein
MGKENIHLIRSLNRFEEVGDPEMELGQLDVLGIMLVF